MFMYCILTMKCVYTGYSLNYQGDFNVYFVKQYIYILKKRGGLF